MPKGEPTELERLRRRLQSWQDAKGPRWLMANRAAVIAELRAEITLLESEARVAAK